MATMLKVEVETGGFYVSRHDAKLSTGAVHDGRSAGMAREEGSVLSPAAATAVPGH